MGVCQDWTVFRDVTETSTSRREAAGRLLVEIERAAKNNSLVWKRYVDTDDVVQQTMIKMLLSDGVSSIRRMNPDADEKTLDRKCLAFVRKIMKTSAFDLIRRLKSKSKSKFEAEYRHFMKETGKRDGEVAPFADDPPHLVEPLIDFMVEVEGRRGLKAADQVRTTWAELVQLYSGELSLDVLVSRALLLQVPANPRKSNKWKREYDKICKKHQRFREKARRSIGEFAKQRHVSMMTTEIIRIALDEIF